MDNGHIGAVLEDVTVGVIRWHTDLIVCLPVILSSNQARTKTTSGVTTMKLSLHTKQRRRASALSRITILPQNLYKGDDYDAYKARKQQEIDSLRQSLSASF